MKLVVQVIEARNLPAMDPNGLRDPYVRLKLGKQRFRTKVVKRCLNPKWGEEFTFRVEDLKEKLVISVLDEDKYFNYDFVGKVKIPVSAIFDKEDKSQDTSWYCLKRKSKKSKNKDFGEILLTVYLSSSNTFAAMNYNGDYTSNVKTQEISAETPLLVKQDFFPAETLPRPASSSRSSSSPARSEDNLKEEKSSIQKTFAGRIAQIFNKNVDTALFTSVKGTDLSDISEVDVGESNIEDSPSSANFGEALRTMELRDQGGELPSNLSGVVLDQLYVIAPRELNNLLFSPDSDFPRSLASLQGTTELQLGQWKLETEGESLKRVVTYIKAATKLVKAVKGTEDQVYLKADGQNFAIFASVSTPDVMYGSTFKTEVLYCISPGPELPSGELSSHLVISWRMNFLQNTMMKGMIENGARQGLKESYEQYATLLSQTVKPVESKDLGSNKEHLLSSLQAEPQSDWKLALQYFGNFTVISTFFVGLYVLVHVWLALPVELQGLEFNGLDLPDSIGELIVSGVLILQGKRALESIARFLQAREQKGTDHGIKAQGDGWLLTVALIEGNNLAAVDSSGFSDPYVVFTCNGRSRTSSIKFQKSDTVWNEVFEFDAMNEPPSVLDVEVYDFDGPFDEATSLGHAEINFVKTNISDLADVWVPLLGKLAQPCQSKLHLRIFLDNTRGNNIIKEYLTKVGKEVGKKLNVRSPQTNSAFQKLFGLPPEEFLINDFTCHLKRKMPLQGRLFLSARVIGFYANLFGRKTKFFFLWEDIEDIQVIPPTLATMGSPIIVMTLRPGRGMDAKHGAKTEDELGRLKFHFQSFVSFNVANRTIMALWKARSLSPEQKVQIVEEDSEGKILQTEESGSFLGLEEVSMSEVYSSTVLVPISYLMELFSGGELERKVMEKAGCLDYSYSPWEMDKDDTYQRQIYYKFDKRISRYTGEVSSAQQKSPLPSRNGWTVEEVMTLHGVPLGDYFNLHVRYHIEDLSSKPKGCKIQAFVGIAWLKSTKHQKRITKNVLSNLQDRQKMMFNVVEREFARN